MTKIRGGKAAYDQLVADAQIVRKALRDIRKYSTNVRLVEDAADDGLSAVLTLDRLITDVIGPMLERRDKHAAAEVDELERRIISIELWVAEFERTQRERSPQLREVKRQERG